MRSFLHLLAFAFLMVGCAHVEHLRENDCEVWTTIDRRTNSSGVTQGKMAGVHDVQLDPHIERTLRVHLDAYSSAILKVSTGGHGGLFVRASTTDDVHVRIPGFDHPTLLMCTRTTPKGNTFLSPTPCAKGTRGVAVAGHTLSHFPLTTEITVISYRSSPTTIDLVMLHDTYFRELERD